MPGMLSKMFEPENNGDTHSDAGLDAEVSVNIHTEYAVEYQVNGEEGGWSQETDIGLTLGTEAALDLLAGTNYEDASSTIG